MAESIAERMRGIAADAEYVVEAEALAEGADEIDRLTAELEAVKAEWAELVTWGRRMQDQAAIMANHAPRLADDASQQALALYDTATVFKALAGHHPKSLSEAQFRPERGPKRTALAQPGAWQGERADG